MTDILNTKDYLTFLNDIKKDIQISRVRAALSVNRELILLYWRIGNSILAKQKEQGWGAKVIECGTTIHGFKTSFSRNERI